MENVYCDYKHYNELSSLRIFVLRVKYFNSKINLSLPDDVEEVRGFGPLRRTSSIRLQDSSSRREAIMY